MKPATIDAAASVVALRALRVLLAAMIAAHGCARAWVGGVVPFGGFLESQGWPFGVGIAWAITVFEIVGSVLLASGRVVGPVSPRVLALTFAAIYTMGIVLVHAKAGWFVVGLGRNGMEFSVLLIACLLAVAWTHRRATGARGVA